MDRRELLAGGAMVLGFGAVPATPALADGRLGAEALRSAVLIGEKLLTHGVLQDATVEALTKHLAFADRREEVRTSETPAQLLFNGQFGQTILEDFEAERIVSMDGWGMSRTEAEICALASLLDTRGHLRALVG